jgi:hypothetical protein
MRDTLLDCVTHHRDIVEAGGSNSWNLHFSRFLSLDVLGLLSVATVFIGRPWRLAATRDQECRA